MKDEWEKSVWINASRTEEGFAKLRICMGATGPRLVVCIGDECIVIASKWKTYTTDHGAKQLIDAINEGMEQLRNREER